MNNTEFKEKQQENELETSNNVKGWDQITNNGNQYIPKSGMYRIIVRAVQYFLLVSIISLVALALVLAMR